MIFLLVFRVAQNVIDQVCQEALHTRATIQLTGSYNFKTMNKFLSDTNQIFFEEK
jgi:hypothetical protein